MNLLHASAIRKASETRIKLGLDLFQPLNIYDVCAKLDLDVQFVDINMEGLYINNGGNSKILLSSLRPFARRVFTCGHELGHHLFNHGLKIDIIADENEISTFKSKDEILVDCFSAALLMPVGGIEIEFSKRNLKFASAKPFDYYIISSLFGVGYQTLILHCHISELINDAKLSELKKFTPAKIFKSAFGDFGNATFFKIIDGKSDVTPIDIEVGNFLSLPADLIVDSNFLEKQQDFATSTLYLTKKPGITSVHNQDCTTSSFVRIQSQNYVGFAEYRHIEN